MTLRYEIQSSWWDHRYLDGGGLGLGLTVYFFDSGRRNMRRKIDVTTYIYISMYIYQVYIYIDVRGTVLFCLESWQYRLLLAIRKCAAWASTSITHTVPESRKPREHHKRKPMQFVLYLLPAQERSTYSTCSPSSARDILKFSPTVGTVAIYSHVMWSISSRL